MLNQIINVLKNYNEKEQAISLLKTFQKYAHTIEEFNLLAKLFFDFKQYDNCIECAEIILSKATSDEIIYTTSCNMINVYNHANYPEKAMELVNQCLLVNPNDIDLKLDKSYSHFLLNEKDQAESILRELLDTPILSYDYIKKINFNLGTYCFYKDKFQEGLFHFLVHGKEMNTWKNSTLPYKQWQGEDISGKTLIVMAEAGIGDEFINIRFMNNLKELGIKALWYTERKDLAKVFKQNGFDVITNVTSDLFMSDINLTGLFHEDIYWTYSMQLPIHLNLEYKDLWKGSYIKVNPEYDKKFEWLKDVSYLKIGLRWQGNPDYDQDLHRSVPLNELYSVLKDDYISLYSLQRDTGVEMINKSYRIYHNDSYTETWDDTIAFINNLDIVITSCTSIAHLSAAMGKRTIVLVPISSYYTWCHSMEQSPWYGDHVTLLRQEKPRSWTEPIQKLKMVI